MVSVTSFLAFSQKRNQNKFLFSSSSIAPANAFCGLDCSCFRTLSASWLSSGTIFSMAPRHRAKRKLRNSLHDRTVSGNIWEILVYAQQGLEPSRVWLVVVLRSSALSSSAARSSTSRLQPQTHDGNQTPVFGFLWTIVCNCAQIRAIAVTSRRRADELRMSVLTTMLNIMHLELLICSIKRWGWTCVGNLAYVKHTGVTLQDHLGRWAILLCVKNTVVHSDTESINAVQVPILTSSAQLSFITCNWLSSTISALFCSMNVAEKVMWRHSYEVYFTFLDPNWAELTRDSMSQLQLGSRRSEQENGLNLEA